MSRFYRNTYSDDGRTISNVTHTAGDLFAFLTLSAPLDSSNDIGIDTLAAASTASIYDASSKAMGTTPAVISGDSVPPSISGLDPVNGAVDVTLNCNLTFILSDNGIGIDWTTFSIQLSGSLGYSKIYTGEDSSMVSKAGNPSSYMVTVHPDVFFGSGEVITVTVNADDLAGNSLTPPAWSFSAAGTAIWETPDAVYDSYHLGGAVNLIDGNLATGNDFSAGGPEHYATFKLESGGDLHDVTDVRIYGGPSYTRTWRIYVSKDGLVYTQTGSLSVGGAGQWYEYTFPATETARYIRINAWHPGPENAEVAFEFQFKGTPVFNSNNAPSLSWTGEVGHSGDGVNPDSAIGGTNIEFRIKYTDADNNAPSVMQVWVDINDNGTYGADEKYAMTEADADDTDYTDGKLYSRTLNLSYAGDGNLNYHFYASDGTDVATGAPVFDSTVIVTNEDAPTGAVGFWKFEEGSGTTVLDETVNLNDGTINGAVYTVGISGDGLSFAGIDDSVDVANSDSLNITEKLTIEMWIKPAVNYHSSMLDYAVLVDRQRIAGTDSYFFGINSDGKLHLGSSGGNIQSTSNSWTAGTWYHVVGTYRDIGGSYSGELYVNGVAESLSVNNYDNMGGGSQTIGIGGSDRFNVSTALSMRLLYTTGPCLIQRCWSVTTFMPRNLIEFN